MHLDEEVAGVGRTHVLAQSSPFPELRSKIIVGATVGHVWQISNMDLK